MVFVVSPFCHLYTKEASKRACVSTHMRTYIQIAHILHLQWEVFEWQVCGMAVSDCGDNGIRVSLQIVPQEMAENCIWIRVKEEKFENPDLFAQLSLSFSSQSKGKEASSHIHLSIINLPTRFIYPLQQWMPSRFHLVTLKETNFLTEMLIILKPSMFSTTFEHYMCVVSIQISVPIRDTMAFVAVCLCLWKS